MILTPQLELFVALRKAAALCVPPALPKWAQMIRDAHEVEIRESKYAPADPIVMDPNSILRSEWMLDRRPRPIMVVCRPEHAELISSVVAVLRPQGAWRDAVAERRPFAYWLLDERA